MLRFSGKGGSGYSFMRRPLEIVCWDFKVKNTSKLGGAHCQNDGSRFAKSLVWRRGPPSPPPERIG